MIQEGEGTMANLVMYLRLSVEDDVNADESNSITNQRRIIRNISVPMMIYV